MSAFQVGSRRNGEKIKSKRAHIHCLTPLKILEKLLLTMSAYFLLMTSNFRTAWEIQSL